MLLLLLPGFALNYGLVLGASHLLEIGPFGIFYTAISIVNLFSMPAVIVGSFFVYDIATAAASGGPHEVMQVYRRNMRLTARWGLVLALVLISGFAAFFLMTHASAWPVFIAIVVTTYASYFIECLRSCLQGTQKFGRLGRLGLSWMAGRFTLGLIGIYVAGTAWGGMAGVALSGILAFLFAHRALCREMPSSAPAPEMDRATVRRLFVFVASYGIYPAVAYLDILLAYFVLPSDAMGAYTASSVLPKALILVAAPIIQVMFPVLVTSHVKSEDLQLSFSKGLLFTAGFTISGVIGLILFDDLTCGGSIGVKNCLDSLLLPLGVSSIALCLIRVLVLHELAARNYWHSLLLLVPAIAFLALTLKTPQSPEVLAINYAVFCSVTLLAYGLAGLKFRTWISTFILHARAQLLRATRG